MHKSRVIEDCGPYEVCVIKLGLTVRKNGQGILLPKEHPHYDKWVKLFDEAVDAEERSYCASILMRNPTTNTRY